MRDGTPLPGRTPGQVLSQLAHRVFGPLHPARTRIVLDYHGLLDHPAGSLVQVAARHHVTSRTVSYNAAAVQTAGHRLPLSAPLIAEATRISAPGDDHLSRVRIAATLGLPAPTAPPVHKPSPINTVPAGHLTVARASMRALATVGPLDLSTLLAMVARTRRFRTRNPSPGSFSMWHDVA
jgi:hypothetical protein